MEKSSFKDWITKGWLEKPTWLQALVMGTFSFVGGVINWWLGSTPLAVMACIFGAIPLLIALFLNANLATAKWSRWWWWGIAIPMIGFMSIYNPRGFGFLRNYSRIDLVIVFFLIPVVLYTGRIFVSLFEKKEEKKD